MDHYGRNRRWLLIVVVFVLILLIAAGIWYLLKAKDTPPQTATGSRSTTPLPRMANLPPPKPTPTPPTPTYGPNAPVIEQAREALREGIDPAGAVALAKTLPESPERPDAAFLLLEYAAEEGNAEAALAVGHYYDPTYEGASGSIRKKPETAYEWYKEALSGGQEEAKKYLAILHKRVQDEAKNGSREAKALIERWR